MATSGETAHLTAPVVNHAVPDGEPTNEELLARIQAQDHDALQLTMKRHHTLLASIVRRVVHCDADVDEVLQEVFIELWNRSHLYDQSKGKALGWLVTMARRRAIDRVRRRQAYNRVEERFRLETNQMESEQLDIGADEHAVHSDLHACLCNLIASLPAAQQDVVRLAFFDGLSQREIAARTGIPLGTIKTRIELGIRKLRSAVAQVGGAHEFLAAAA